MTSAFEITKPLPGAQFGGTVRLTGGGTAHKVIAAAEATPEFLPTVLAECDGLLLLSGMNALSVEPGLLVRLSQIFGAEVEDYRLTLTDANSIHQEVPEILLVSSIPPTNRQPPRRPDPPFAADGKLPTQYPHRRGWHTDQSYRRPPPDISLFYAVTPVPQGQGQTIFANGAGAYDALPPALKAKVDTLEGLHIRPFGTGRSRSEVLAGETPRPLAAHETSQPQPVARVHPITGRKALYLCESNQMDWLDGPFVGMAPGPHGDGARLLDELMAHLTRPEFIYVHEWNPGDLLVWDNRCLVHTATWFDADKLERVMWRTTVHGNPGALYAGERKSWIPAAQEAAAAD
jgi:taurine dioxygenase